MSFSTVRAIRAAGLMCCLMVCHTVLAQGPGRDASGPYWQEQPATKSASEPRRFTLDLGGFAKAAGSNGAVVALPLAKGGYSRFALEDAGAMDPALAARFPQIRSLRGVDNDGRSVRLDVSPEGINAMVFADDGVQVIRPAGKSGEYESFARKDGHAKKEDARCEVDHEDDGSLASALHELSHDDHVPASKSAGSTIRRTYRLALSATGEYTAAVCAPAAAAVQCGLAAMATTINRVNEIYENDLGVRLVLIADNDRLVYTNAATDPFTNGDASAMLDQNQSNMTETFGNGAYDIGHVFGTGNVGRASIGVTCKTGSKARGATGRPDPRGDAFDVDFVAHEIGHQFRANHTFNGNKGSCAAGNRVESAAFEPGSGSTIMGYAGICGVQNLQASSDPYFHAYSLAEMRAEIEADTCDVETVSSNRAPVLPALPERIIPARTPFALVAEATDADGDLVTYTWEQLDLGPVQTAATPDAGATSGPLLRSFPPSPDPERTVPRLATLLGAPATVGDAVPTATRSLSFRVSARDNHVGGGAVSHADMAVKVVDTGRPFAILSPNDGDTGWTCGRDESITWDVAGTDAAPIACDSVDVLLSSNGGISFDHVLATGVPNSGQALVRAPFAIGGDTRLQLRCSNNIFFDISEHDFQLFDSGVAAVNDTLTTSPEDAERIIAPAALLSNDRGGGTMRLTGVSNPLGGTVTIVDGKIRFVPTANRTGEVGFDYTAGDSCARSGNASAAKGTVRFTLAPVNDPPVLAPLFDFTIVAQKGGSGEIPGFGRVEHFGAPDEAGQQVLGYLVDIIDNGGGVVTEASISPDGTLRASSGGVAGTAVIRVRVRDNGGTAGGGNDTSEERIFRMSATDHASLAVEITAETPTVSVGGTVKYHVTLENAGAEGIGWADLRQSLPAGIEWAKWSCTADNATCPNTNGSGALDLKLPMPPGGKFSFIVTGTVSNAAGAELRAQVDASIPNNDGTAVAQTQDSAIARVVRTGVFADGMESR